ncbi:hypothetical protein PtA15_8A118 [Puccinia triticina]|uniref:Uncharacterized protein n=1 Tax=Puccinia triticina TaxID=208348 RepID=A0ABY7CRW5_9BASI|nr:uncharacterized protein PtA15_8A118 [Puccinia triticina]WAQ87217.1 hypothetical protein PtA15_8A118 [Puccinia triticina]WAR57065.1 hypothetical protein PtB15_8B109 [Puccinia triticina]
MACIGVCLGDDPPICPAATPTGAPHFLRPIPADLCSATSLHPIRICNLPSVARNQIIDVVMSPDLM